MITQRGDARGLRRRNARGEGARLKDELIEAASGLLAELGDAERLSIRAVARAAGVTPPAVYRHFADRRSLLVAVLDHRFQEFDAALDQAAAGAATPFDALHRRCMAYLAFARDHPGHYQALFKASSLGPRALGTYDRRAHPGAASFNALVEAVQRCLDLRRGPKPSGFFLAVQLWSLLHGIADLRISKPQLPWPPAEALAEAGLAALGLPAAPSSRRQ